MRSGVFAFSNNKPNLWMDHLNITLFNKIMLFIIFYIQILVQAKRTDPMLLYVYHTD